MVTENDLRMKVVNRVNSWLGATRGSEKHLEILEIYNSHKPLARGYTVKVDDAYCATTVSSTYIDTGISEFTGTECGANELIKLAQEKGIWVENDDYVPKLGDAVAFDWDDSGSGDNKGYVDHVGIIIKTGNGEFTTTEGNMDGGKVGQRTLKVNAKNIRGFICPNFAEIAEIKTGEEIMYYIEKYTNHLSLPTGWDADKQLKEAVSMGITDGKNPMGLATRYMTAIMVARGVKASKNIK